MRPFMVPFNDKRRKFWDTDKRARYNCKFQSGNSLGTNSLKREN